MSLGAEWGRAIAWVLLGLGGIALAAWPAAAPVLIGAGVATAFGPLARAWKGARGTALRAAVAWCGCALALALAAQVAAWREVPVVGQPLTGHLSYLTSLATLAALTSVLNARTPGGGAWAILMVLLILVFLIPWLEGPNLARDAQGIGRLRLPTPWNVFYVLVVIAGVTNYAPTRYGPATAVLALGFAAEFAGLTRSGDAILAGGRLWSVFPWLLAVAIWTAEGRSRRGREGTSGLERSWFWFRDHWGVVWALRVQERFNCSAEALRWPIRLGWDRVAPASGDGSGSIDLPIAAEATFQSLLRRFAEPERIEAASSRSEASPCQPSRRGG
jgi:hypothetical protein